MKRGFLDHSRNPGALLLAKLEDDADVRVLKDNRHRKRLSAWMSYWLGKADEAAAWKAYPEMKAPSRKDQERALDAFEKGCRAVVKVFPPWLALRTFARRGLVLRSRAYARDGQIGNLLDRPPHRPASWKVKARERFNTFGFDRDELRAIIRAIENEARTNALRS